MGREKLNKRLKSQLLELISTLLFISLFISTIVAGMFLFGSDGSDKIISLTLTFLSAPVMIIFSLVFRIKNVKIDKYGCEIKIPHK